ncbi:unnamed protein product [Parascedosporium putredinis]|uniref:UBC core domain-containing protein n=1 Tax=Parascedosporium putredinis TaxID=1442378 RepID=A0A9P1H5Z3_9PEZI|nr:unnamed protein product [Parascedosporium putredinis]CAI7998266.1 unnamed protein product [Parascedosporium putredinis]
MSGGASSRGAAKRLLKELERWSEESKEETGIERLGPPNDEDLLTWEAVINGKGIGGGYDGWSPFARIPPPPPLVPCSDSGIFSLVRTKEGRWLLNIEIPSSYPIEPPKVEFVTPVVHPNVALTTGEICLDLLKTAWTPAYSILEVVRAIRMLLSCPETDSPLNVDVAALLRGGDAVGGKALVELWCKGEEGRYDGP